MSITLKAAFHIHSTMRNYMPAIAIMSTQLHFSELVYTKNFRDRVRPHDTNTKNNRHACVLHASSDRPLRATGFQVELLAVVHTRKCSERRQEVRGTAEKATRDAIVCVLQDEIRGHGHSIRNNGRLLLVRLECGEGQEVRAAARKTAWGSWWPGIEAGGGERER